MSGLNCTPRFGHWKHDIDEYYRRLAEEREENETDLEDLALSDAAKGHFTPMHTLSQEAQERIRAALTAGGFLRN